MAFLVLKAEKNKRIQADKIVKLEYLRTKDK